MDLTKDEIKNEIARKNNFDSHKRAIRYTFNRELLQSEEEFINKITDESMEKYAEQEAKAFANWIQYQDIGRKTTDKLWKEFREQVS